MASIGSIYFFLFIDLTIKYEITKSKEKMKTNRIVANAMSSSMQ